MLTKQIFICFLIVTALSAFAQDKVTLSNGTVREGTVIKIDPNTLTLKMAAGEVALPRKDISQVEVQKPADVDGALKAAEAKKCADALPALKAVTDKYSSLAIPWLQQAHAALGDCLMATGQWPAAVDAFKKLLEYYPKTPYALKAKVGLGQALLHEAKYDEALKLVEEATQPLRKELTVSADDNRFLGTAMIVLGDCYQAKGDLDRALDCYLSTVVLYYRDKEAVQQAQQKADKLKEKIKASA
jgi:tetratricopeptide (TPR) repeat protein